MQLTGIDHADIRVRSLSAVEPFFDALLPVLGLSRKTESHVDGDGEWCEVDESHARNAIEYSTPVVAGRLGWFLGFIEDPAMMASQTRIALALDAEGALPAIEPLDLAAGGLAVEWSTEVGYPALFF